MSRATAPDGPAARAAGPGRPARAAAIEERELPPARYSYAGDEFLFVELSEEMSFRANFRARAILQRLEQRELPGLIDLCPNSTSYLIRFDPDEVAPDALVGELKAIDSALDDPPDFRFRSRVVDVPILYDDPWSTECLMRYRDRHQDPEATDLQYMARINGFRSVPELIEAHAAAPYLVMGVGFTPACYWSVAMVPRERIIVAPTYIRPRIDTPERAFSHGGCFAAIYPSPGPGGYQLIGMAPAPIFDVAQALPDFAASPVFTRTGDIFKHRPIDRDEFDTLRAEVEAGTFRYAIHEHDVEPGRFLEDPAGFVERLLEGLYGG
ncbi:MAG: urea carboxylase [Solirubrobacteraceae bacterium]|jgi:urea carboxylase|nr:urea carboxylase [Solirubrobacteraceae bacterium]